MSFDIDRIRKSTRRVGKFFRENSKRPSSKAIHNLRTSARSLETTFATLGLDSKRKIKRLLRDLGDVRKRAGKVRDMDVLTADALTIRQSGEQDCLVRLLEHLGAERSRRARKLRSAVGATGRQFQQDLKRISKLLDRFLKQDKPGSSDAMPTTMAKAMALSSELKRPAQLNRSNLHPYRLKVKELRDVLLLSDQARDQPFLEKLGEVKDAIGEWHDWEELIAVAEQSLNHGASCKLMRRLKVTSNSKYERALSLTNHLRRGYLEFRMPKRTAHRARTSTLSTPVLEAASAIAQP